MSLIALALAFPNPVQAATVEDPTLEPIVVFDSGGACRILSDGDDLYFRGCNVYVQNETGASDEADGLGNLVVGWAESDGTEARTGSHNLVVGPRHDWQGTSGLIAGEGHTSIGDYGALVGGRNNLAERDHGAIVGGRDHSARGAFATIAGGVNTRVSANNATFVGGFAVADLRQMKDDLAAVVRQAADHEIALAKLWVDTGSLSVRLTTVEGKVGEAFAALAGLEGRLQSVEKFVADAPSAISSLQTRMTTAEGKIGALFDTQATHTSQITSLLTEAKQLNGDIAGLRSAVLGLDGRLDTAEVDLADLAWTIDGLAAALPDLEASAAAWSALSQHLFLEAGDVVVRGANLRVQSGAGATDADVNGKGNVIIGYDEGASDFKVGSHNLVVGENHSWGSHSGILAGYGNLTAAPGAVSFGAANLVFGNYATITGGVENFVGLAGDWSSIAGGRANEATSSYGAVSGGFVNTTSGDYAWVGGGTSNTAEGDHSSVVGGTQNTASGVYASVQGGVENTADGFASGIGGGRSNRTDGDESWVAGGTSNRATGDESTVLGGWGNEASGRWSTASGGTENEAVGEKSSVAGGMFNRATGPSAAVSGGYANTASGTYANVIGGSANVASGTSSIAAGGYNTASGIRSVAFGYENVASGEGSSVLGGFRSESRAEGSVVVGGFFGLLDNRYGTLLGGRGGYLNDTTWGGVGQGSESYPCFEGCF